MLWKIRSEQGFLDKNKRYTDKAVSFTFLSHKTGRLHFQGWRADALQTTGLGRNIY